MCDGPASRVRLPESEREVAVDDERVQLEPSEDAPSDGETIEDVVRRGCWSGTPWAMLGGVAAFIWLCVAVTSALVLLVWWLA